MRRLPYNCELSPLSHQKHKPIECDDAFSKGTKVECASHVTFPVQADYLSMPREDAQLPSLNFLHTTANCGFKTSTAPAYSLPTTDWSLYLGLLRGHQNAKLSNLKKRFVNDIQFLA